VIYSWTPREFKNFIKGAKLRRIDSLELCAVQALFTGKVKNAKKKIKLKDIYDADKARKEFEKTMSHKKTPPKQDSGKYNTIKESMRSYKL